MELRQGRSARQARLLCGALVASSMTILASQALAQQSAGLPKGAILPGQGGDLPASTQPAKVQKAQATSPAAKPAPRSNSSRPVARAPRVAADPAPTEDPALRSIAVNPGRTIPEALTAAGIAKGEIDGLMKAAGEHLKKNEIEITNSVRLRMAPSGIDNVQLFSPVGLTLDLQRKPEGGFALKSAPGSNGAAESERRFVAPTEGAIAVRGPSRNIVPASINVSRFSFERMRSNLASSGIGEATVRDAAMALSAVAPAGLDINRATFQITYGKTDDGVAKILGATVESPAGKARVYWYAPHNMPEGFFDGEGRRVGGAGFGEPIPGSRVSSAFGYRGIYLGRGRGGGSGFHNGLDIEGKPGTPIYAAADGVVNYQGWYYNYGRTVKITHSNSLETLYAHMSSFAGGVGPGSTVRKGDLVGYVGSTGRSTGPHLHFSVIANGEFVDPTGYLAQGQDRLLGHDMVSFRHIQQQVDQASRNRGGWFSGGNDAPSRPMRSEDAWKNLNRL
jgi:murein DD-endopeptidase MepM/ murein hydrolase activator NlpD